MDEYLKVQSVILIQYIYCQLQHTAPHGPLPVCPVYTQTNNMAQTEGHTIPANQHIASGARKEGKEVISLAGEQHWGLDL